MCAPVFVFVLEEDILFAYANKAVKRKESLTLQTSSLGYVFFFPGFNVYFLCEFS